MPWAELRNLSRPRWRADVPALWRDRTTLQLGDDVILEQVKPEHVQWLRDLDGSRTSAHLVENATIPEREARRLLRALINAGALVDAALIPSGMRFGDTSRRECATTLLECAVSSLRDPATAVAAMERRDAARVLITGEGPLRNALAIAAENAGLTEVALTAKATVVLLADAHHPHVPARFEGAELDLPHVHVGVNGARGVAGPLVVPGVTSCLRCAHLHRRDADWAWPVLAAQWAQALPQGGRADPLLIGMVAHQAVHLLRSWLDAPAPADPWTNVAYEMRLAHPLPRRVMRPPHPLCGCRWGAV